MVQLVGIDDAHHPTTVTMANHASDQRFCTREMAYQCKHTFERLAWHGHHGHGDHPLEFAGVCWGGCMVERSLLEFAGGWPLFAGTSVPYVAARSRWTKHHLPRPARPFDSLTTGNPLGLCVLIFSFRPSTV